MQNSYLEKSMEARLLFFTTNNCFLAHFKKVDKGWVGLHQLFRLEREKTRTGQKHKKEDPHRYKHEVLHKRGGEKTLNHKLDCFV